MTILCITTEGLPGIRPCREFGEHRVTCRDHPGWDESQRPGRCRGCLPRAADHGYLCQHCYDRVEHAYPEWAPFRRLLDEAEGRTHTAEGGSSSAMGYSNLTVAHLAIDEVERHLQDRGDRTIDLWVHTPEGAAHAILFAAAAEAAYRTLKVDDRNEHEPVLERTRCPHCQYVTIAEPNRTREVGAFTIIECQWCGGVIDKVRTGPPRWVGSETCEHEDHLACARFGCECDCHRLGRASQQVGIEALWNADMHTASPASAPRGDWAIDDAMTIRRLDAGHPERKIA